MAKQVVMGFCHVANFVRARYGGEAWQRVLAALPEDAAREIGAASAVAWYDLALYVDLLHKVVDLCAGGDRSVLDDLERYELKQDLNIFVKIIMRALTPRRCLESVTKLWNRVHDSGRWEVAMPGPKEITGILYDWGCVDAFLCLELRAYIARLLECTGVKDVVVFHNVCRASGANACEFVGRWH